MQSSPIQHHQTQSQENKNPITQATGPCVILAGAGTGKTYAMVEKVKYLVDNQIYKPEKIACLTFSNEAARSLEERIKRVVNSSENVHVSTFHSFSSDLLKKYGKAINLKEFDILTPDDAKILLHKYFKIHPQLCQKYIETIGIAKDLGISKQSIEKYITDNAKDENLEKAIELVQFELNTLYLRSTSQKTEKSRLKEKLKFLSSLIKLKKFLQSWTAYEKIKDKRELLDYSDLNNKTVELLKSSSSISEDYDYIIVDEYQDTNKVQFNILCLLAKNKNITIVGDANQSIYRFRGAYKDNIKKFKEFFHVQEEQVYNLDKSYRSPNTVLNVAHQLIEHNYENKNECFKVLNKYERQGNPVEIFELEDEKEENRKIIELIEKRISENIPLKEICVMFRTHQQSARLKKSLFEKKIPFISLTKKSLFETPHVKKLISYLDIVQKILKNENGGELSWWSIFSEDLEKEILSEIGREIKRKSNSSQSSAESLSKSLCESLSSLKLPEKAQIKVKETLNNIKSLIEKKSELLKEIIENTCKTIFPTMIEQEAIKNLEKFKAIALEYEKKESPNIQDFLYHLKVMQKLNIAIEAPAMEEDGVRIMTHHSTKGLEFDTVICSSMVQGKFPSEKIKSSTLIPLELFPDISELLNNTPDYAKEDIIEEYENASHVTEERRLCYVAFTRTKEKLFITYAKEYNNKPHEVSQFLKEIDYKNNENVIYKVDSLKISPLMTSNSSPDIKVKNKIKFSPSSLLLFADCQKRYEYKYIYNMPEKEPDSWEEMRFGSFIHEIIEEGIKNNFKTEKEFIDRARIKYLEESWFDISLDETLNILKIFFHRNKNKYNAQSLNEIRLRAEIQGLVFEGYADRIDTYEDGIEIIDYKTGRSILSPRHRNWQLGFYALAAPLLGKGPVKRLTLDMLRHEKPLEFDLTQNGIAKERNSYNISFNLNQVKQELIETASKIIHCCSHGFEACDVGKNCDFCNNLG